MDVDVKLFEEFYKKTYEKTIDSYYELLKKTKTEKVVSNIVLILLLVIIYPVIFYFAKLENIYMYIFLFLGFFYYAFIFFTAQHIFKFLSRKIMYDINQRVLRDIILFISKNRKLNTAINFNKMLNTGSIDKMDLFNLSNTKYIGKNYFEVMYGNNKVVFSDANIYYYDYNEIHKTVYMNGRKYIKTIRKRVKKDIFNGIYIGLPIKKKVTNKIYLIPNTLNDSVFQSKIRKRIKFHGTYVMLENLDICNRYKVYCDNEIKARELLSLEFMERINKLDSFFNEKKYIVFKESGRFSICIDDFSIEKIKEDFLPLFRKKDEEIMLLCDLLKKINNLFNIYDIFNQK